ncbi:DUF411 domain-containing protein [Roseateles puraquae]|uniref:Metal-binding protein n=1 Tax=Roseateles puraquae TaxID=431059 RepID=A0A254MYF0_9BURK|nr:DUF411 domain-containing protein [Roseateles puraquae]MDG0855816.1 DUF411 domain-containing protein [Roseateles puraquae]OWQ99969.1 metal-binding protein [Roseateles puraquae]
MPITSTERQRRLVLGLSLGLAGLALPCLALARPDAKQPLVTVWKDPNCGCCKVWVEHLRSSGLVVQVREIGNIGARRRLGVPEKLASCHTAEVAGYVVEGHVPAREILRLLKEKPEALGLAVPSMPIGSPGMDSPEYGGRKDPYQVLLVARDGSTRVYQNYP